jgi:hypothetical protein
MSHPRTARSFVLDLNENTNNAGFVRPTEVRPIRQNGELHPTTRFIIDLNEPEKVRADAPSIEGPLRRTIEAHLVSVGLRIVQLQVDGLHNSPVAVDTFRFIPDPMRYYRRVSNIEDVPVAMFGLPNRMGGWVFLQRSDRGRSIVFYATVDHTVRLTMSIKIFPDPERFEEFTGRFLAAYHRWYTSDGVRLRLDVSVPAEESLRSLLWKFYVRFGIE